MKLKSILSAAVFAVTLTVSASVCADYPLSLEYSDGYINWSNTTGNSEAYSGTVIAAAYEDGKMTKVKSYSTTNGKPFINDDFYNGENVKFMFWGGAEGIEPLAQAGEAQITGAKDKPVSVTLAVLDEVTATDDINVAIILPDGSRKSYKLQYEQMLKVVENTLYSNTETKEKRPLHERVIEYTLNESNELDILQNCYSSAEYGVYRKAEKTIGGIRVSDETKFLDENCWTLNLRNLVDGEYYSICAYDRDAENNCYRFALIGSMDNINLHSKLAVFNQIIETKNYADKNIDALDMFAGGEQKLVYCKEGVDAQSFGLSSGDLILYEVNNDGEITELKKLFKDGVDLTDTESFWTAAKKDSAAMIDREFVQGLSTKTEKADLYIGAIVDRSKSWFTIADIKDNISDVEYGVKDFYIFDANVYEVDYNNKLSDRISVCGAGNIRKTLISIDAWLDYEKIKIDWSKNTTNPYIAIIRTIDGDEADIVLFKPEKSGAVY